MGRIGRIGRIWHAQICGQPPERSRGKGRGGAVPTGHAWSRGRVNWCHVCVGTIDVSSPFSTFPLPFFISRRKPKLFWREAFCGKTSADLPDSEIRLFHSIIYHSAPTASTFNSATRCLLTINHSITHSLNQLFIQSFIQSIFNICRRNIAVSANPYRHHPNYHTLSTSTTTT